MRHCQDRALRRAWRLDGSASVPTALQVREVLHYVGWQGVRWQRPNLRLKAGMEIDFGSIGKEYAVDRAITLAEGHTPAPFLVNFGGDLRVSGPRRDGSPWKVAIEDVDRAGSAVGLLAIS